MKITPTLQKAVHAKIDACIAKASAHYKRTFTKPNVLFTLRGTTAGTANYIRNEVNFNPDLLIENEQEMLNDTVPHEMAHLFTDVIFPHAHRPTAVSYAGLFARRPRRAKRSVHGHEWQSIMRVLGADPSRCHSMDTTNAQVKVKNKFHYNCGCMDHFVGPVRHKRIARGATYSCRRCRGKLVLVKAMGQVTYSQAKEAVKGNHVPAPKKPAAKTPSSKAPAAGSKMAQCYSYYKQYPTKDRAFFVTHFVNVLGMTAAGAQTYYYNCKKLHEQSV